MKIGIFVGSTTGNSAGAADAIKKEFDKKLPGATTVLNVKTASPSQMGGYDVVIIGCPTWNVGELQEESNLVFDTMKALAAAPSNQVAFFDGGRFITPDRLHTSSVATCLSRETGARCGTSKDPTKNYIRDSRHEHLCPLGGQADGTCAMYSSGAVRLTLNLRDGIRAAKVAKR